jgi:hypothetical protein
MPVMPAGELNSSYLITLHCHIAKNRKQLVLIINLLHWAESFFGKLIFARLLNKLLNRNVHYSLHKKQPLVPFLNRMKLLHTIQSYQSSVLILSSHLRLCLPIVLLPSSFYIDSFFVFFFCLMCDTFTPPHFSICSS